MNTLSSLPQTYAWAKQCPKALVVHQPSQCFGGYEYGRSIEWLAHGVKLPEDPTPGRKPCSAAAPIVPNSPEAADAGRPEPVTR